MIKAEVRQLEGTEAGQGIPSSKKTLFMPVGQMSAVVRQGIDEQLASVVFRDAAFIVATSATEPRRH
jgi:hypothetical protein